MDFTRDNVELFVSQHPDNGFSLPWRQMLEDDPKGEEYGEEEYEEEYLYQRDSKGGYSGKDIAEIDAFFYQSP